MRCRAKYKVNNAYYNVTHCVGYNITFHINKSLKSSLNDKVCNIPKCILDTIYFECTFIGNNSEIEDHDKLELNKTSFNKTDPRNQQNTTAENRPCLGNISFNVSKNVLNYSCHGIFFFTFCFLCRCCF